MNLFAKQPLRATGIITLSLAMAGYPGTESALSAAASIPPHWIQDPVSSTFTVDSMLDSGPGTLRDAIIQANASPGADTIVFRSREGLFAQPQTLHLSGPLPTITDTVTIDGYIDDMLWKPSGVTLDGQNAVRILDVDTGVKAKIAHLTLTNGHSDAGAALHNRGHTVLSGMLLTANNARQTGGAIHNAGQLQLINSTLYQNRAGQRGGGLYNAGGLRITHATFDQNASPEGGAIYSTVAALMHNSIVANSQSPQDCFSQVPFDGRSHANIIETSVNCGPVFSSDDPKLGTLGGYNGPTRSIAVSSGSRAFNWADNTASTDEGGHRLIWDQRGNGDPRFALGIADIGAFEIQPRVLFEVDTLSDEDIRGCTGSRGDCSLRGALQLLNHSDRHQRLRFDRDIFKEPRQIQLRTPLPEIQKHLTLDAGETPGVTLTGHSQLRPASGVKLEVINVQSH